MLGKEAREKARELIATGHNLQPEQKTPETFCDMVKARGACADLLPAALDTIDELERERDSLASRVADLINNYVDRGGNLYTQAEAIEYAREQLRMKAEAESEATRAALMAIALYRNFEVDPSSSELAHAIKISIPNMAEATLYGDAGKKLIVRAEVAEAQAAAMRAALKFYSDAWNLRDYVESGYSHTSPDGTAAPYIKDEICERAKQALASDAGRALLDELEELRELKRRLEALPDNTCLQHSEGWEHGNDWFVLKDEGADRHMGMGKTPIEALRQAQKGEQV